MKVPRTLSVAEQSSGGRNERKVNMLVERGAIKASFTLGIHLFFLPTFLQGMRWEGCNSWQPNLIVKGNESATDDIIL